MEFLRSHVLGLLEVEPLSFTTHATSDGTRVERLDAAPHPPSTAHGPTLTTVPFTMGPLGIDDPPPTSLLSPAGAAAGAWVGAGSGSVMADSLKKLAQMYAKQLHPGYKHIQQLISDHGTKAGEVSFHLTALIIMFRNNYRFCMTCTS